MDAAQARTTVLLIAGLGRSGSTVLGRVCGRLPGFANVGELGQLWRNGFIDDVLCGCGQPLQACAYWQATVGVAFGGFDGIPAPTLDALTACWEARRRLAVQLALPLPLPAADRPAFATYSEHLGRVLAALRSVSGCSVVVDTSKTPAHLAALAQCPAVELHVIHLIRDSRAVAHSWAQRRRRRQTHRSPTYIEAVRPPRTALRWNGINVLTWLLRQRASSYARVRYEDFAGAPQDVLPALLRPLGATFDPRILSADGGGAVQHTVGGNGLRFETAPAEIRLDAAWETAMPRRAQLAVTALTWPLLLALGYPLVPPVRAGARPQSAHSAS